MHYFWKFFDFRHKLTEPLMLVHKFGENKPEEFDRFKFHESKRNHQKILSIVKCSSIAFKDYTFVSLVAPTLNAPLLASKQWISS